MFVELRGLVAIGACGVSFPEFLTALANLSPAFLYMQLIKRELAVVLVVGVWGVFPATRLHPAPGTFCYLLLLAAP